MKTYDTFELLGFSDWASALFNGGTSGLEGDEEETLDRWLAEVPEGFYGPVDMREEDFRWDVFEGIGGNAATYVFMKVR